MPVLHCGQGMKLKARTGLMAGGVFLLFYGLMEYRRLGTFPYLNYKMQPVFPVGTMIVGGIFVLVAFLPADRWVERMFSLKPRRKAEVLQKFPPRHR